ncbi:hypothetical protein [Streptomyces sp. NBC_00989]|nr:hypothetical protein OG714_46020 [Streptomyces sp. NBC_00989]
MLIPPGRSLVVFTATPGTESHRELALLAVPGTERFATGAG